jgi:hypothetical protein
LCWLFWGWVSLYAWDDLNHDPPIHAFLCSSDDRLPPHLAIGWDTVFWAFYLGQSQAIIFPIFVTWVARIYRLETLCPANDNYFICDELNLYFSLTWVLLLILSNLCFLLSFS